MNYKNYDLNWWLLALESIRQQLDDRTGIQCPHLTALHGAKCICGEGVVVRRDWKNSLERLCRWAMAGHFGVGDWKPLQCPNDG